MQTLSFRGAEGWAGTPTQRGPASDYPRALSLSLLPLQLSSLRHLTQGTKSQLRKLKSRDIVSDASNNFMEKSGNSW